MTVRIFLLCSVVILSLLLIWQLILIITALASLLTGIEIISFDSGLNQINNSTPRIIHQIWKTSNLLTYPINTSHLEWKKEYPNYEVNLWTDKQIEELISKQEYIYLYSVYKSYSYRIQRADLARLIILHSHGGIYADLDAFPSEKNIEDLRLQNASLIIPRSSSDICLVNHFLMAEKHSHLLNYILHSIYQKSFLKQIHILPYLEVFSTGSIFLTNIIRKRMKRLHDVNDRLLILSSKEISRYAKHGVGRSWHLFDGYLINTVDDHRRVFFIFCSILCMFCLIKLKNVLRKLIRFSSNKKRQICIPN